MIGEQAQVSGGVPRRGDHAQAPDQVAVPGGLHRDREAVQRAGQDGRGRRLRHDLRQPADVVGMMVSKDHVGHVSPARSDVGELRRDRVHGLIRTRIDKGETRGVRDEKAPHIEVDRLRPGNPRRQVDIDDN